MCFLNLPPKYPLRLEHSKIWEHYEGREIPRLVPKAPFTDVFLRLQDLLQVCIKFFGFKLVQLDFTIFPMIFPTKYTVVYSSLDYCNRVSMLDGNKSTV